MSFVDKSNPELRKCLRHLRVACQAHLPAGPSPVPENTSDVEPVLSVRQPQQAVPRASRCRGQLEETAAWAPGRCRCPPVGRWRGLGQRVAVKAEMEMCGGSGLAVCSLEGSRPCEMCAEQAWGFRTWPNRMLVVGRRACAHTVGRLGRGPGAEFHWTGVSPRCPSDICGGVWWALGSEVLARDANVGDI